MAHFVRTVEGEEGNELGAYREMVSLDSGRCCPAADVLAP